MMTKSPGELPSLHFLGIIRLEVGEEPGDLGTVRLPLVCSQLLRIKMLRRSHSVLYSDIFCIKYVWAGSVGMQIRVVVREKHPSGWYWRYK